MSLVSYKYLTRDLVFSIIEKLTTPHVTTHTFPTVEAVKDPELVEGHLAALHQLRLPSPSASPISN